MMNHNSCEVFFDNMEVPAENLVGQEGRGFRYILDGMNAERLLIAAECIGDAKWFTEKSVAYAKERVLFSRPIGQNQGVQFPIARAYAQMRAAEAIVQRGLEKFESGIPCGEEPTWARCSPPRRAGRGRGLHPDPWRLRLRRGIRHRAQVPRNAAVPGGADLTNLILSYLGEHVLGMPRSY
jgi:alkylation response protein AidB-like acyl-CoA dehydrogenase